MATVDATAHPADVTSAVPVTATSTEATTEIASSKTTTTAEATSMTATAPTSSHTHRHQQTGSCVLGVADKASLRERCRSRESERKSADTKRDDAALHDCTSIVAIVHGLVKRRSHIALEEKRLIARSSGGKRIRPQLDVDVGDHLCDANWYLR
jgi:hypothetical protein